MADATRPGYGDMLCAIGGCWTETDADADADDEGWRW